MTARNTEHAVRVSHVSAIFSQPQIRVVIRSCGIYELSTDRDRIRPSVGEFHLRTVDDTDPVALTNRVDVDHIRSRRICSSLIRRVVERTVIPQCSTSTSRASWPHRTDLNDLLSPVVLFDKQFAVTGIDRNLAQIKIGSRGLFTQN